MGLAEVRLTYLSVIAAAAALVAPLTPADAGQQGEKLANVSKTTPKAAPKLAFLSKGRPARA
jgi:hypothetical protein